MIDTNKRSFSQVLVSMKIKWSVFSSTLQFSFICLFILQNRVKDFCSKFDIQSSNIVDEHTTHLITDEEAGETLVCPLSKKVIQAIARHMYIVTYRWIDACLEANRIVDEKSFEIQGDLTLASDHHGLLSKAGMQRIQEGFFVCFFQACNEVDKVFYPLIYRGIFYWKIFPLY